MAIRWTTEGPSILNPAAIAAVKGHLESVGNIAVSWWHMNGARAPTVLAFDDFEEFQQFLRSKPAPGDAIDVWPFPDEPAERIAEGKVPNEQGEVPEGGAY